MCYGVYCLLKSHTAMLHKLPKVKLILQKTNKEDADGYIYLRVGIPTKQRYILRALGHKIPEIHWNAADEVVTKGYKEYRRVNSLIAADKEDLLRVIDDHYKQGANFTEELLRELLLPDGKKDGDFLKFWRGYIDNLIATNKKAKGTIAVWETLYSQLVDYTGGKLSFNQITTKFLNEYHESITGYEQSTVHKKLKKLLQIVRLAIAQDYIQAKQIAGFEMVKAKNKPRAYLTLEQTEQIAGAIYKGEFDDIPELKQTACYFLIGCWSGLRISDWRRFTIEKLIKGDSLKVGAQKNNEPIYIPLNVFTRLAKIIYYVRDNNIRFTITDQAANRLLKTVGGRVKLSMLLTAHVSRHTAATLLGEMGYSAFAIAQILGITERTATIYRKATRKGLEREYESIGGL